MAPRRIVMVFEGTWQSSLIHGNNPPSNVGLLLMMTALAGEDENGNNWEQIPLPNPGIGTGSLNFLERLRHGAFGTSIDDKIRQAYINIASNYSPGDELFFFGFSRGAYTARSLAGFISELGILERTSMTYFSEIYAIYQKKPANIPFNTFPQWQQYLTDYAPIFHPGEVVIKVIGVWDTVGSLGGFWKKPEFHNISLHPQIKHAFHALALDETRNAFKPTLWQLPEPSNDEQSNLCQVWFPGTHIDIGGGNSDIQGSERTSQEHIANITLAWMIDRIRPYIALDWEEVENLLNRREQGNTRGYAGGPITRPGWIWWLLGRAIRTPGRYHDSDACEYIHPSVQARLTLAEQGQVEPYNPAALAAWTREEVEGGGYRWTNGTDSLLEFMVSEMNADRSAERQLFH